MDLERNDQMVNILLAIFQTKPRTWNRMHIQALRDWHVYATVRPSVNGF